MHFYKQRVLPPQFLTLILRGYYTLLGLRMSYLDPEGGKRELAGKKRNVKHVLIRLQDRTCDYKYGGKITLPSSPKHPLSQVRMFLGMFALLLTSTFLPSIRSLPPGPQLHTGTCTPLKKRSCSLPRKPVCSSYVLWTITGAPIGLLESLSACFSATTRSVDAKH